MKTEINLVPKRSKMRFMNILNNYYQNLESIHYYTNYVMITSVPKAFTIVLEALGRRRQRLEVPTPLYTLATIDESSISYHKVFLSRLR